MFSRLGTFLGVQKSIYIGAFFMPKNKKIGGSTMRKFKVTFFNPETLKKSVTRFIFQWDYNNHCWSVTSVSIHGEHTNRYTGDPMGLVNHYIDCCLRKNEYASVKSFA